MAERTRDLAGKSEESPQPTSSTSSPPSKRPSKSTHTESGRPSKTSRPSTTPPPPANEGTEGVSKYMQTPSMVRLPSHCGLTEHGKIIYAANMEERIAAEARGVTRKKVPWAQFCSIYLRNFEKADVQSGLGIDSVRKLSGPDWEEGKFLDRLRHTLRDEDLHDLKLSYSGNKPLSGGNKGKEEVPSKPDFVLHVDNMNAGPPTWADVEFLFEHTRSQNITEVVTSKFSQWLRGAWSVFSHQPFRRHLYGILFINPCAYICYADHGCAAYSEALSFENNDEHTQHLTHFLSIFIAKPECRGRDPTVRRENDQVLIEHAGKTWVELDHALWYRPCIVGRNIRVSMVRELHGKRPLNLVMKSTWEEKLPPNSSPPSEVEVLKILKEKVRGLPQPYHLEEAIKIADGNPEVETCSFPKDCKVALTVRTREKMANMQSNYSASHTSKTPALPATRGMADNELDRRIQTQRVNFNSPVEIRRRLTRVIVSYCRPLKDAMRDGHPKLLMKTIRDSMIVYYEAYKRPESGFLHGDISIENILVPVSGSQLTGGLTYEDRCGTLIDWNLCFSADGTSSERNFRSGTPAFMSKILLSDKPFIRRTLAHDMESFFAVIIWIASLDYHSNKRFQAKPLASILLDRTKASVDIVNAKTSWFSTEKEFQESIIDELEQPYYEDEKFLTCLFELREILYPTNYSRSAYFAKRGNKDETELDEGPDRMKEDVFRKCMKAIDDFLGDPKGSKEIELLDSLPSASHSQASKSVKEGEEGSG